MDQVLSNNWEEQRQTITRLYELGFGYTHIRQHMRRKHGFVASDAAFKRQFKEWGLRRNATEDDYRILAKLIHDLGIDGWRPDQRPNFRIRGRQLDYYSVVRSIKRLQIVQNPGETFVQPAHIKLIYPCSAPLPPLATPTELALPEIALLRTQQIYKLSTLYDLTGGDHLRRCQDSYRWALQAINQTQYGIAREQLVASTDHLALAAKQGTLHLSPLFCYAIIQARADRNELVRPYLEEFLDGALELIKLYYSTNHSFSITFQALLRTDLREELSVRILELIIDQLNLGDIHNNPLSHELSDEVEIILIDTFRQLGQLDRAISRCHGTVNRRAQLFPALHHPKRLAAQNTLANCYLSNNGDWRGAETALQVVFDADKNHYRGGRWPRTFLYFESLRLRAVTLRLQSRPFEAAQLVDQAMVELCSPDLELSRLEAILHAIIRMMDQNARYREASWMRAKFSEVIDVGELKEDYGGSTVLIDITTVRLQQLVREYFESFGRTVYL